MCVDDDNKIININRLFLMTQSICPKKPWEESLTISQIKLKITEEIKKYPEFNNIENNSSAKKILEDVDSFFDNIFLKLTESRNFLLDSLENKKQNS